MLMSFYGYGSEKDSYNACIAAAECGFDKNNFLKVLRKELMDDGVYLVSEITEGYWRIKRSNDWEYGEFGEYCYTPCKKGKGATLAYSAEWRRG